MRCFRCSRRATALTSNPSRPTELLCEFCIDTALTGVTEPEPSAYRAGKLHKASIEKLLGPQKGNGQRVMTTETFNVNPRPEVRTLG